MKRQRKYHYIIPLLLSVGAVYASSAQATCAYAVNSDWSTGFQATVTVTNDSSQDVSDWEVTMTYGDGITVSEVYSGEVSGSGPYVVSNKSWNGTIAAGESTQFTLLGTKSSSDADPTATLSGDICDDSGSSSDDSSSDDSSSDNSSDNSDDSSSTSSRLDNPFRDATWYVDPDWSEKVAAEDGGSAIADMSTAIWMDRIGAIEGSDSKMGLKEHLDTALEQGANLFTFVVYDLPNRDCNSEASNGELLIADGDMERYKTEFIDPIAEIISDSKYSSIRIVAIIEIDSLPNLVTNSDVASCQEAAGDDGYVEGITYALNAFAPIENVYSYLDAAHSGWLGWSSNFDPAIELIASVVEGTDAGWDSVAGFITNTANYTPTVETYLPNPYKQVNNEQVRSATFYEWNPYFDEKSYALAFREKMIAQGAPDTIGMLIDTGRNGWGGSDRPSSVSTSGDVDTYVDESRIDRRDHRGNWCNQPSGIGYKPWADPYDGVDAFVWVKPPGESDGVSTSDYEPDPDDPAKQYDPMCGPDETHVEESGTYSTGAMSGAPHAGRWFSKGFQTLLENAYPSVDEPAGAPEE
jgi:cellulose 1,4-beta-cellobiosidase